MKFGKKFEHYLKINNSISVEDAEKLPTPRLLVYFKKHRGIQHMGKCDCGCGESFTEIYDLDEATSEYYMDCEKYIDALKAILDKREHIE